VRALLDTNVVVAAFAIWMTNGSSQALSKVQQMSWSPEIVTCSTPPTIYLYEC
jgi:hypothetical protein